MKSAAERARSYRARARSAQLEQLNIVVPIASHEPLRAMAQYLRDHPNLDVVEFIPYYRDSAGRVRPMTGGL